MDLIVAASMTGRIQRGSDVLMIWYSKQFWGWRDDPLAPKASDGKGDEYDGNKGTRVIRLEVTGGLPSGSTPEKPDGDNYSEVPPEEQRK